MPLGLGLNSPSFGLGVGLFWAQSGCWGSGTGDRLPINERLSSIKVFLVDLLPMAVDDNAVNRRTTDNIIACSVLAV